MKHLISVSLVGLLWSGMSSATESSLDYAKSTTIEPRKSFEVCMSLSPEDKLYYTFTASSSLRFNIHYHEGEEVRYPVSVKLTSSEKAVFEPESQKNHCLMWNNPGKEAVELKLEYRK